MHRFAISFCSAITIVVFVTTFSHAEESARTLSVKIKNGSPAERVTAIERVGEIDAKLLKANDPLIGALTESLKDDNDKVRIAASRAIKQLGPVAIGATPTLIAELVPGSYTPKGKPIWNLHSEALASFGSAVVPQLLDALETKNETQFQGVCAAIHNVFPDLSDDSAALVLKEFALRLENETSVRRWSATYAVVQAGDRGVVLIPQLISVLDDKDFRSVMTACQALANMGPSAKPAVDKLMEISKEGVTSVRGHSALALGSIGPIEGIDIVGRLREMLSDPNATVSERALIALGKLGPAAAESLEDVSARMLDEGNRSRSEAALAHWRISGKVQPALDQLIKLIEIPDYELDAIEKIGSFGNAAESALPALVEKFESGDAAVQIEVCAAVAGIGIQNESARKILRLGRASDNESVRAAAIAAQKKMSQY